MIHSWKDRQYNLFTNIFLGILAGSLSFFSILGFCLIAKSHKFTTLLLTILSHESFFNLLVFSITKFSHHELLLYTTFTTWVAILLWFETFKPGELKQPLTFNTPEIYFGQHKTIPEILKLVPLFNNNMSLSRRIAFCLNLVSIAISLANMLKTIILLIIDSQPKSARTRSESDIIHRFLKSMVVIAHKIITIPLKVIEPFAFIPYIILYFFVITLPDFFEWLFFDEDPLVKFQNKKVVFRESTAYIKQKLIQTLNANNTNLQQ